MNWTVQILRTFAKDLAGLPPEIRATIEQFAFQTLPATANPYALPRVEKLHGFRDFYKVRFGVYRLGLRIHKAQRTIEVRCVRHRREFYRHFP